MIGLTTVVLFLVYLNVPAVAVRIHGAPYALAAALPMALAIPVAYRVLLRGEPFLFPKVFVAAFAMLLLHALSALLSIRPMESLETLEAWLIEGILLALLLFNALRTRSEVQAAVSALIAAGAVMGAVAIAQQILGPADHAFFGFGQLDSAISDADGQLQRRLAGPIGETNRFAQIMAVLIPLAVGCAIVSTGWVRVAYALAGVLICGGMTLAYSRGAIVALALSLPFAVVFGMLRLRHVAVAVVVACSLLLAMPHYAKRVSSIGEIALQTIGVGPVGLRNADGAARGRITEMKSAGLVFLDRPLLGAGPGMAPYYYEKNASVVGGKVRAGTRRSHNLYLQLAAETGLLGLGAFMGVVALVLHALDAARRRFESTDRKLWGLVCGLELAVVISLATSLFLHAAYIRYFWLLVGISAAATAQHGVPALVTLLARMLRETALRIRADA